VTWAVWHDASRSECSLAKHYNSDSHVMAELLASRWIGLPRDLGWIGLARVLNHRPSLGGCVGETASALIFASGAQFNYDLGRPAVKAC
jgi:hypothetical protein